MDTGTWVVLIILLVAFGFSLKKIGLRGFLWIAGFIVMGRGIQLTGFDSDAGTVTVIFGAVLLVIAFVLGRAAKKKAAAAAAQQPQQ